MPTGKLKIMVASTVHGFQDNIVQVCATLEGFGYEVWNSHHGTLPVNPSLSNLENCKKAVRNCDLFLGIIRPQYGSGIIKGMGITHEEIMAAVDLDKPRWFLVHRDIDLIQQFMKHLYAKHKNGRRHRTFYLKKNPILDNLKVFEMYNYSKKSKFPIEQRKGNWVQHYFNFSVEGMKFINAQFRNVDSIQQIVDQMSK